MLYMGYVGFSVAFAFAIAALISGRLDAAWARWTRPWTTTAWLFLTIGITLGSWWAYNELGWGGWWFWDPVENARSEEHTSELQSLMRISYAVFCLKKKNKKTRLY